MTLDFLLLAIPLAIVGARLYYVVFEWENYAGDLLRMFAIKQRGLVIYGGVIGAVLFSRVKRGPLLTLLHLEVPSPILGQVIGRWVNFVNQEAFGNVVHGPALQFFPVAVYIEKPGEWHQATFLYENAWNAVLLCVVLLLGRKGSRTAFFSPPALSDTALAVSG